MLRISLIALLVLAAASACVPHDLEEPRAYDPRPVDMVYQVTVEQLSNSCDNLTVPDGLLTYVDIMPRSDGTVDLYSGSVYIPLPDRVAQIVRDQGWVDHLEDSTSTLSGDTYWTQIKGYVTPDKLDLTVDAEDEKWGIGVHQLCRRQVHIVGTPLPLRDPKALPGIYRVSMDEYGKYCFYQPRPEPAKPLFYARLDIRQYSSIHQNADFSLNGRLALTLPLPDKAGKVEYGLDHNGEPDLSGRAFDMNGSQFYEYRASAKGQAAPSNVDLDIWFGGAYDDDGDDGSEPLCGEAFRMHGKKLLPSAKSIDGYWRMEVTGWNGCKNKPVDDAWPAFLIGQADGTVDLWENDSGLDLKRDGRRVYRTAHDNIEGYDIRLEGVLQPPNFIYFLDIGLKETDGWCWITMQATGVPRFLK